MVTIMFLPLDATSSMSGMISSVVRDMGAGLVGVLGTSPICDGRGHHHEDLASEIWRKCIISSIGCADSLFGGTYVMHECLLRLQTASYTTLGQSTRE